MKDIRIAIDGPASVEKTVAKIIAKILAILILTQVPCTDLQLIWPCRMV
ncbi:MAG: hypothetical protein ACLUFP_05470 [Streptococcus salivarius]